MLPASDITVMGQAVILICLEITVDSSAITQEKTKLSEISTRACALAACHRLSTHQTLGRCIMLQKIGSPQKPSVSSRSALFSNSPLQIGCLRQRDKLDRDLTAAIACSLLREKMVSRPRSCPPLFPQFAQVCWCARVRASVTKVEIFSAERHRPSKTVEEAVWNALTTLSKPMSHPERCWMIRGKIARTRCWGTLISEWV
jgi:hypothetical protein